jgi:uncharacterized membrane protein
MKEIQVSVKSIFSIKFLKILIVLIYFFGFLGIILPFSRELFLELTDWILLFNAFLVLWFHRGKYSKRTVLVFFSIYILGFFVELIGVNTGVVFGAYHYGEGLGIKLGGTPLLIGTNWLILSYCFASVIETINTGILIKSFLGAFGMLIYDSIMEHSAAFIDMWYWKNEIIPLQNYLAWFILAFAFQLLIRLQKEGFKNPIAATILIGQFGFFIFLLIYQIS